MELIRGVYYEEIEKPDIKSKIIKETPKKTKETKSSSADSVVGMNFSSLNDTSISFDFTPVEPKKSTSRKKSQNTVSSTGVVPVEGDTKYSKDEPYMNKYMETNAILKSAIAQIDIGLQEMQGDLAMLRANKTARNKFQQMSLIQGNMGNYLGNKISAARELNNTISKCNDLELKRAKELMNLENQDDDKRIMDMYNAFISMPTGGQAGMANGFSNPLGPSTFDMTYAGNPNTVTPNVVTTVEGQETVDAGYQNYLANKSPAQNMMSIEHNPNIQQVVVYNQTTGQAYFDVMDMTTMTSVPNTEHYDNSFLNDTHLDLVNNVATNVNIGESYPIVQIGKSVALNEY